MFRSDIRLIQSVRQARLLPSRRGLIARLLGFRRSALKYVGALIIAPLSLLVIGVVHADEPDLSTFQQEVKPFLATHCVRCHGDEKEEGGLRLDMIGSIAADGQFGDRWREIQRRVLINEMPPEKAIQPSDSERVKFLDWVAKEIHRAEQIQGTTGGKVVLRRLNRSEYRETLRELLYLHPAIDTARDFPDDDTFRGFDNIGSALNISPVQLRVYFENAANVIKLAFPDGKAPKSERTRILAMESLDYYRGADALSQLRREMNGKVIPKAEADARLKAANEAIPNVDISRTIIFGVVGEKEYLPDGVIFSNQAQVRWSSRPAGIYKFRFHVKGIPNKSGDLPMMAVSFSSPPPNAEQSIQTTDVTEEFHTYEMEAYAQPDFTTLRFAVAAMGSRFFYKRGVAAPRLMVQWVEIEGPIVKDWPSKAWHEYFGTVADGEAGARAVIEKFAERAFRRPVDPQRIEQFLEFYRSQRASGDDFETSIKSVMQGILGSPEFVFMIEAKSNSETQRQQLDDFELATRLAYFLWSGPPDDELYMTAKTGTLHRPEVLTEQTRRMMKHPRASRFAENFTGQWLKLRTLGQMAPDQKRFVEWEDTLQESMRKETEVFFLEILQNDLPLTHFIDSDFAMLNGRLAYFYGIEGVSGYEFRRVALNGNPQRGGLLGQASIQTLTSDGLRTSPVKRGAFVLENMLGDPPPPPPNDVPPVQETTGATLRDRLASHRAMSACASCHDKIDPIGFALENFNAIGKWREIEEDTKLAVDPSGKLKDGKKFESFADFKRLLVEQSAEVTNCVAEKLMMYSLGRPLDFSDGPVIKSIVERVQSDGDKLSTLVMAIVTSPAFTTK